MATKPLIKRAYLLPKLRPFQDVFLANATKSGIDTACFKSSLVAMGSLGSRRFCSSRILDPRSRLFVPGTESVLCAASLSNRLESYSGLYVSSWSLPVHIRFVDSAPRGLESTHVSGPIPGSALLDRTVRLRSGWSVVPWAVCDEPGAWESNGRDSGIRRHRDCEGQAKLTPACPVHWNPRAFDERVGGMI